MKLSELLQKYAKGKEARPPQEDTNTQMAPEQGELFMDSKGSVIFQKILSVFPGARAIATRDRDKSTEEANLDR